MLQKIQDEVNEYRNGKFAGMFPEQWLPKAIAVLPEAFTEQNHIVNSTMKIVRRCTSHWLQLQTVFHLIS